MPPQAAMPDATPSERPLHITGERVVDQFAHLMPTANLTLMGILQGLVLGALLTHAQPPASFAWQDILHALLVHDGYLTFIGSFLIIVLIWIEYVYAFFTIHWPLRSFWIALQFALVIPEFALVISVNSVGAWVFWAGIAALLGALIRIGNRWVTAPGLYRLPGEAESPILHGEILTAYSYRWELLLRFGSCFYIIGGYLREVRQFPFDAAVRLPSGEALVLFDVLVPLGLIAGCIAELRFDDAHFARVTEHILRAYHMAYRVTAKGILDERPRDELARTADELAAATAESAGTRKPVEASQRPPAERQWRPGEPGATA